MTKFWVGGKDFDGKRIADAITIDQAVDAVTDPLLQHGPLEVREYDESKPVGSRIGKIVKHIMPTPRR